MEFGNVTRGQFSNCGLMWVTRKPADTTALCRVQECQLFTSEIQAADDRTMIVVKAT